MTRAYLSLVLAPLASCAHPFAIRPGSLLDHGIVTHRIPADDTMYEAEEVLAWRNYQEVVYLAEFGFTIGDMFETEYTALPLVFGFYPALMLLAAPLVVPLIGEAAESPLHFVIWQVPAIILPGKEGVGMLGREYATFDEIPGGGGRPHDFRPAISSRTWYTEKMPIRMIRLQPRAGGRK